MIRVYDESGNVIETHEHKGDFKEMVTTAAQNVSTSLTRFEYEAYTTGTQH